MITTMTLTQILIYVFILFFSCFVAILVVSEENPVYGVIFLLLFVLFSSFIIRLFALEIIALFFILIYAGAVIVFFVFLVLLINFRMLTFISVEKNITCLIFLNIMSFAFFSGVSQSILGFSNKAYNHQSLILEQISTILYTYYTIAFIGSGCILLIGVVGVLLLLDTATLGNLFIKTTTTYKQQVRRKN